MTYPETSCALSFTLPTNKPKAPFLVLFSLSRVAAATANHTPTVTDHGDARRHGRSGGKDQPSAVTQILANSRSRNSHAACPSAWRITRDNS